jgi:hypothetical protein
VGRPTKEQLLLLYSTLTCRQIAKKYSVTPPTIQRWLRIYGVVRRDRASRNKLAWANMASRERRVASVLAAVARRPTRPEQRVIDVIANYDLPLKYTGDGSFIIAGLNPDFINCNGKKIAIEVFGDYWHKERAGKSAASTEEGRRQILGEYGWDLVVLWCSEMERLTDEEIAHLLSKSNKGEEVQCKVY